ncbi:MAG: polysaccharide biosynthesis/export family protein [Candidatus Poribacteria bacterium]|nr:polysaccharide biosynthesis/export family protein [Candidatus Poribacteria bacterium]
MRNTDLLKISHGYLLVLAGVTLAPIKEGHCFLRFLRLFLLSFCLFFLTRCIAPANSPAPPKPYTLQVGDRIDVTVEGYSEYSKQIVLRLDGFISYPLIGEIHSEGLTIPELESAISEGLAERLDNPRVFVTLVGSRQRSIYVWGTVQLASRYLFETEQIYLLQALAMAGGPDYEKAKLTEIQIWRGGKIHQIVDVTRLMGEANQADIPLQSEDVVYVPSLLQQRPIMVTGAVLEQGVYEVESPEIHPLQALMMAGGPTQDLADLARAQIIRSTGDRVSIDLKNASSDRSTEDIVMLRPGDTLHIPDAYEEEKISIMGAVTQPGQYLVKKPVDMIEALALAGGWDQERANLKKGLIIRMNGEKEQINLLELLEAGNPQSGPVLYPGDRLQVPNRLRINWSALLTVISAATLIYNIAR